MFVFSNLATTLDGKIASISQELFLLGTKEDHKEMQVLRKKADAVLMGASTLRSFRGPILVHGAARQPLNVLLSSRLEGISPRWKFFTEPKIRRLLFVMPGLPASKARQFEKSSEIISLKKPTRKLPLAQQIIQALAPHGVRRLLVEGGGGVMWEFVSHDLIDEYHLTLTPRLLGGSTAPTLVDGAGLLPREIVNVRLEHCKVVGNELFLTYRKTGKRG